MKAKLLKGMVFGILLFMGLPAMVGGIDTVLYVFDLPTIVHWDTGKAFLAFLTGSMSLLIGIMLEVWI